MKFHWNHPQRQDATPAILIANTPGDILFAAYALHQALEQKNDFHQVPYLHSPRALMAELLYLTAVFTCCIVSFDR